MEISDSLVMLLFFPSNWGFPQNGAFNRMQPGNRFDSVLDSGPSEHYWN
jgi:hypothetical protein